MNRIGVSVLLLLALLASNVGGFFHPHGVPAFFQRPTTALHDGRGVASTYSWVEEPFELEVSVKVPPDTRAKDITFKATPTSIDLRLQDKPLLDGSRRMRGRISLDGTYWVISDAEDSNEERVVTVTIEKSVKTPQDDFEVIDYDWKGVYPQDEEEVTLREYDEPEELDVREYAASLGVDIDNINMSMVDKSMFSSGLNLTRSTMDQLTKAGYVQEVTQQADGSEYTFNEEGESVPFSKLGDTVSESEVREAAKIPFLDTDSPWNKAVPVDDLTEDRRNATLDETKETSDASADVMSERKAQTGEPDSKKAVDPIDALTVKRLKEILRAQGLKVSGSKQELRDRLRTHVQSMMMNSGENTTVTEPH